MAPNNEGIAPKGPNVPGVLPRIKKPRGPWECRVCGYKPNLDRISPNCINCGRDFWGNPGTIPTGVTRSGT